MQDFNRILEQCKKHVTDDIRRLDLKIKERLEWSDSQLMRAILVFLETQSWQESFSASEGIGGHHGATGMLESDDFVQVRTAVDLIVSTFRIPLEAKGMCTESIQDEVEDYLTQGSTSR